MERSLEKTRLDINMDRIDLDDEAEEIETQVAATKKEQFEKYESGAGQQDESSGPSSSKRTSVAESQKAVRGKPLKKRKAVSEESEAEDEPDNEVEDEAEEVSVREPSPIPIRRTGSSRRTITKASSVTAPTKVRKLAAIQDRGKFGTLNHLLHSALGPQ